MQTEDCHSLDGYRAHILVRPGQTEAAADSVS